MNGLSKLKEIKLRNKYLKKKEIFKYIKFSKLIIRILEVYDLNI